MCEIEYILIDHDFAIYDGDDSVCANGNDGILPEEIEEYDRECRMYRDLKRMLCQVLGYEWFRQWANPLWK